MVAKRSPWVSFPARQLAGFTGAALQRSVHALSSATRVERSGHADVAHERNVVHRVAVAVGRHVAYERYVEAGLPTHHRGGVFGDLALHHGAGLAEVAHDRVAVAHAYAAAAAHALRGVDIGLAPLSERACFVRALLRATAAAHTLLLIHSGMHRGVHGLLAAA